MYFGYFWNGKWYGMDTWAVRNGLAGLGNLSSGIGQGRVFWLCDRLGAYLFLSRPIIYSSQDKYLTSIINQEISD